MQTAVDSSKRLIAFDPLREESYRALMSVQYQMGDRAAALETFQQCEKILQTELGVPPMPETINLRDAILQDVDREPPPPPILPVPDPPPTVLPPRQQKKGTAVFKTAVILIILLLFALSLLSPLLKKPTLETVIVSGTAVVQDTWLNDNTPDLTYDPAEGTEPYHRYPNVHLMYFSYPLDRVLTRFDLAALPIGAQIEQAHFYLHLEDYINPDLPEPLPADVSTFLLLHDWQPETATFNTPWSHAGLMADADYEAVPLGTQSIEGGEWIVFDVTAVAQQWLAAPAQNYGLMTMITRAPQGAHYWVHTTEYPLADQRPRLEITYAE